MTRVTFILVLLVMTGAETNAPRPSVDAQLIDSIAKAVARGEPTWLQHSNPDPTMAPDVFITWQPASDTARRQNAGRTPEVSVQVSTIPADVAPDAFLRELLDGRSVSPSKALDGVGDEAFLWISQSNDGAASVLFRKGRLIFSVSGDDVQVVLRFASLGEEGVDSQAMHERQAR